MKFEFIARIINFSNDYDVVDVGFANSPFAEAGNYLLLSRSFFDLDEDIRIEYGNEGKDGGSSSGAVLSARLDAKSFVMKVDAAAVGVSEFRIGIACPLGDGLRDHLKTIFCKSTAKLTLA